LVRKEDKSVSPAGVIIHREMHAKLYYRSKLLQAGELQEALELSVTSVLGKDAEIKITRPRHTGRSGVTDDIELGVESLRPVVDLSTINFGMEATLLAPQYSRAHVWFWSLNSGVICLSATGEKSVQCLERLALNLGLEESEEPADEVIAAIDALTSRVLMLENVATNIERRLKCFISFKFDDAGTLAAVDRLKRLLTAVRVDWLTGEQFEPRRIEDKVKAQLRADVDFVIAVISKAGESKWIRDELSDANARGLWIVLVLEDGATFDKGIFGTLEHLRYGHAIGQIFPEMLEGINFIRAEISNRVDHHKA
jgi:hypothetical protein